ncbi:MAG: hypothetical protein MUF01_15190 [Bryobacterales bacterium]|nr:hypothetical protein [Bryobacterales bacterium]
MGSPTNVLRLEIAIANRQANQAIDGVNRGLEGIGKTGTRAGTQASQGLASMDLSLKGLIRSVGAFAAGLASAKAAASFVMDSAKYAARTEMFTMALAAAGKAAGLYPTSWRAPPRP